jgi:hypothetical protein
MKLLPPEAVNLHGTNTGREALSHTRLGVLLACQQKFYWSYEQRLEPAVKKTSLSMGAAFAHALEHADPKAGCDLILEEHDALVEEYANNPWITVPAREDAEIAGATVLGAAGAYLAHYGHTDVQREITMRARVRNPATGHGSQTFDIQARIDGLTGDRLIEDKFVGRVDQITERRLMLDRQVTIGCYLHWRTTGQEIREVSYRLTKKPSIKRRQNESHDEFLRRLVADYGERPEFYLHEFTLTRTPEDFLRLEAELWRWAEQVRDARRDGVFPRNTAACADFGGCQFLPLCCREPGAATQFVEREDHKEVIPNAA